MIRGGKGKGKNLATGALLPYKLKVGKGISLYGEKGKRGKSSCWSCSNVYLDHNCSNRIIAMQLTLVATLLFQKSLINKVSIKQINIMVLEGYDQQLHKQTQQGH